MDPSGKDAISTQCFKAISSALVISLGMTVAQTVADGFWGILGTIIPATVESAGSAVLLAVLVSVGLFVSAVILVAIVAAIAYAFENIQDCNH
jgi:hypothetical protein